MTKPYATTFETSSKVKTPKYTTSKTAMNAAFCVPGGSSGDSQAMVVQLVKMVTSMRGSNHQLSTM